MFLLRVIERIWHLELLNFELVSSVFHPIFWKSIYRHISVKSHRIFMKFYTQQQIFLNWMDVTWCKNEKVALDRHWVPHNVFFIYVEISVISAWFCEHARQPNILVSLFTMFQYLLTVIQDCLQLFWQYLSSTGDDFNCWVYVLTLEVITGVVVFVTWHDKVGCRRQQQQRPTYYMFTFTHKPRPIVDLTPLSVFPVPVVLERSDKKFYRQVGFVYVTCSC